MAARQCPNCGGYKTYSWWPRFIGQTIGVVVLSLVGGGIGLLLVPMLVWAWFKKPAGMWPHCCRICEYGWDVSGASDHGSVAAPRPGLLHLGNDLLEREAAAAAELERQRRSRGG
jgi:hypothetical protein